MPSCHHCAREFDSEEALRQHSEAKHSAHREPAFFEKHKPKLLKYGVIAVVLVFLLGGGYMFVQAAKNAPKVGPLNSVHWHANWSIIINGGRLDMSVPKYQLRDKFVHMEDGNEVIHKHATGVTFGLFLKTLKWELTDTCLKLDTGESYCAGNEKKFTLQINNQTVTAQQLNERDIQDGDYYLIRYQ